MKIEIERSLNNLVGLLLEFKSPNPNLKKKRTKIRIKINYFYFIFIFTVRLCSIRKQKSLHSFF